MTLDTQSNAQNECIYKPEKWMWNSNGDKEKQDLINFFASSSSCLQESRDCFVSKCMQTVTLDEHGKDSIDNALEIALESNSEKACVDCGCEADPSFRICRNYGEVLIKPTVAVKVENFCIDTFESFEQVEAQCPSVCFSAGEPDFVNPNSFITIIQILQNIGCRAGIKQYGGSREWLIVECDGLPYNTMRDLQRNVWRCRNCKNCFYGTDCYNEHECYTLLHTAPVREFDWLVPVMGLLHLEMKAARSFIKLNWSVFVKNIELQK